MQLESIKSNIYYSAVSKKVLTNFKETTEYCTAYCTCQRLYAGWCMAEIQVFYALDYFLYNFSTDKAHSKNNSITFL